MLSALGSLVGSVGRHRWAVLCFLAVVGLLALLTGCTELRTVTVPAGEASINLETDTSTLAEYPPVDLPGVQTQPTDRTLIDDTASGPPIGVQRVEVDRRPNQGQVRFLWEEGSRTIRDVYDLPAYGEMLVWKPSGVDRSGYPIRSMPTNRPRDTPADTVRDTVTVKPLAEIIGAPQEQTLQAKVTSEPPWYTQLWTQVRMLLAFVAGAFTSYVVVKLVPGL